MKNQLKNLIQRFYSSNSNKIFSVDQIPVKHVEDYYTSSILRRKKIDRISQSHTRRTNTNL